MGRSDCNSIPDIKPEDNVYQWAIVDKDDNILGYFEYYIDRYVDCARNFGLYAFDSNHIIGIDIYRKMKELVRNHHRIEWCMVAGNPVERHYDTFCAKYGGKKIKLQDATKDTRGMYHDVYIYEIIKE